MPLQHSADGQAELPTGGLSPELGAAGFAHEPDSTRAVHLAEDASWWTAWHSNDDERARFAFECLYRRHVPFVLRFARSVAPPGTAEDIVQDVFVNLWTGRRAIASNPPVSVRAYLCRAVRNGVTHRLRRQRLADRISLSEDVDWAVPTSVVKRPDEELASQELHRSIARALHLLAPQQRLALLLRQEGFGVIEVAFILGVTGATVKALVRGALGRLRRDFVVR